MQVAAAKTQISAWVSRSRFIFASAGERRHELLWELVEVVCDPDLALPDPLVEVTRRRICHVRNELGDRPSRFADDHFITLMHALDQPREGCLRNGDVDDLHQLTPGNRSKTMGLVGSGPSPPVLPTGVSCQATVTVMLEARRHGGEGPRHGER